VKAARQQARAGIPRPASGIVSERSPVGFDAIAEGGAVARVRFRRAPHFALVMCVLVHGCSSKDEPTAPPTGNDASTQVAVEQVADHQACTTDADCHVVWTNCTCYALRTDVAALADSRTCITNTCFNPQPTGAGCNGGRCALFFDPNCAVDTDCGVVWSRCLANAVNVDPAAPCACAAVHAGTTKTNALVSPDGQCLKNNAVKQAANAICDTPSARCMFGL
jgi:hypothetical protein